MTAARIDGATRREALLDAALACFEERGLVRTGIEDIRKAAGASPSSVYHLFTNGLPELIAALLERTFVRRYREVTAQVVGTTTARAAVHTLVEAHLAWVFDHPVEARFMYRALALDMDDGYRAALRATKEALKAELNACFARLGVVAPGVPSEAMIDVVLLGTTHQACRSWLTTPSTVEAAWMKRKLPGLAWQTAKGVAPKAGGGTRRPRAAKATAARR